MLLMGQDDNLVEVVWRGLCLLHEWLKNAIQLLCSLKLRREAEIGGNTISLDSTMTREEGFESFRRLWDRLGIQRMPNRVPRAMR